MLCQVKESAVDRPLGLWWSGEGRSGAFHRWSAGFGLVVRMCLRSVNVTRVFHFLHSTPSGGTGWLEMGGVG